MIAAPSSPWSLPYMVRSRAVRATLSVMSNTATVSGQAERSAAWITGSAMSCNSAATKASSEQSGVAPRAYSRAVTARSSVARHIAARSSAGRPILLKIPPSDTPNTSGSRFFRPIITSARESLVIGCAGLKAAELTRPMILETSDASAQIASPYCSMFASPRRWSCSTFIGATKVEGSSATDSASSNNCSRRCCDRCVPEESVFTLAYLDPTFVRSLARAAMARENGLPYVH